MVVDSYARSAQASRIVQARLPICAALVTQFVTHIWRDLATPFESVRKALGESTVLTAPNRRKASFARLGTGHDVDRWWP